MISGLVVTLTSDAKLVQAVVHSIKEQPALEIGKQKMQRLPLVLETNSPAESQEITDWLQNLPGVEYVDVAFVHLDELQGDESIDASPQTAINRN